MSRVLNAEGLSALERGELKRCRNCSQLYVHGHGYSLAPEYCCRVCASEGIPWRTNLIPEIYLEPGQT